MKNILFTFLALTILIAAGTVLGRSLASGKLPAKFTAPTAYTLVQETRDGSGKLLGTQTTVHSNGRHYWQYIQAETGNKETWLLNERGGFRDMLDPDGRDPDAPKGMFQVRGAGRLLTMPDALQSWEAFRNQPGFVRFDSYQGFAVAVVRDEEAENWIAPEFWPRPLKIVRAGATTEMVGLKLEVDEKVFETPKE